MEIFADLAVASRVDQEFRWMRWPHEVYPSEVGVNWVDNLLRLTYTWNLVFCWRVLSIPEWHDQIVSFWLVMIRLESIEQCAFLLKLIKPPSPQPHTKAQLQWAVYNLDPSSARCRNVGGLPDASSAKGKNISAYKNFLVFQPGNTSSVMNVMNQWRTMIPSPLFSRCKVSISSLNLESLAKTHEMWGSVLLKRQPYHPFIAQGPKGGLRPGPWRGLAPSCSWQLRALWLAHRGGWALTQLFAGEEWRFGFGEGGKK